MKFTLSMPGTKLAELPRIIVGMNNDEVENVLKMMPSFYGAFHCDRKQKQMRFLECGNNKVTVTTIKMPIIQSRRDVSQAGRFMEQKIKDDSGDLI